MDLENSHYLFYRKDRKKKKKALGVEMDSDPTHDFTLPQGSVVQSWVETTQDYV